MSYTKIEAPDSCPVCGSSLERIRDQLFCTGGNTCSAQNTGKVTNFCKKLKIKGFGSVTVEKLGLTSISDLLDLEVSEMVSKGITNHMANKLVDTLTERLKQGIDYRDFLTACSIPLFGDAAGRKLDVESISGITEAICERCGLGDKVSNNLCTWVETEWPEIEDKWKPYLTYNKSQAVGEGKLLGITVVITGKLTDFKNRREATTHLELLGFTVKSAVNKDTDYLICEDGTTGSSYKKAVSLNKPITTIKDLEDTYVNN